MTSTPAIKAAVEAIASFLVECKAVAEDSMVAAEYWRVAMVRRGVAEARTMRVAEEAMADMFGLVLLVYFGKSGEGVVVLLLLSLLLLRMMS